MPNERGARLRTWRDLVEKIRTAKRESEAEPPPHLREKCKLVNLRCRRPVGPSKMPLPLQQVDATTLDVKKKLLASLDKVAAGLEDGLRRRRDRKEREPIGLELRQVWRPLLRKTKEDQMH